MDLRGPKAFLLFLSLTFVSNFYVFARIHAPTSSDEVTASWPKLTLSPKSSRKANDALTTWDERRNSGKGLKIFAETYKPTNFPSPSEYFRNRNRNVDESNSELLSEEELASSSFDGQSTKRSTRGRKGMPREKQRKAKVLGRLLMNNAANQNDEDMQDDYMEDEVDDYFRGVNKKKMNWDAFQNEDGPSVMELIALDARHKTNTYPDE